MQQPTPTEIANKIQFHNGLFNGHPEFVDAFISVLPESAKDPANDSQVQSLYREVKALTFDKPYAEPEEHWALVG